MSKPQISINEIELENFQALKGSVRLKTDGITILVGPNSSGKSAVIDALQSLEKTCREEESDFLKHGEKATVGIKFTVKTAAWNYTEEEKFKYKTFEHLDKKELTLRISGRAISLYIQNELFCEINGLIDSGFYETGYWKYINKLLKKDDYYEYCYYLFDNSFGINPINDKNNYSHPVPQIYCDLSVKLNKNINIYESYQYQLAENWEDFESSFEHIMKDVRGNFETPVVNQLFFDEEESRTFYFHGSLEGDPFWGIERDRDIGGDIAPDHLELIDKFVTKNLSEKSKKRLEFSKYFLDDENRKRMLSDANCLYDESENVAIQILRSVYDIIRLVGSELNESYSHVTGSREIINSEIPFSSMPPVPLKSKNQFFRFNRISTTTEKYVTAEYGRLEDKNYSSYYHYQCPSFSGPEVVSLWKENYLKSLSDLKIKTFFLEEKLLPNKFTKNLGASDGGRVRLQGYLKLVDKKGNIRNFSDVGSGYSYVFPILTSLWSTELSLIEQPELHLHPKLQSELADVFIDAFNRGRRSVIETHSEHLILRFIRRLRDTSNEHKKTPDKLNLQPENLNIYYFEPRNGTTVVKQIRLDQDGEFLNIWPNGFFTEREEDLFS